MNIFEELIQSDFKKQSGHKQVEVDRLRRMHTELSTKANDFKVITGTGLTPPPSKEERPSQEDMLTQGYAGNTIVHSIIRKVAEVASQIQWTVQVSKDGVEWIDEEGEVQAVVDRPNTEMTANEFRINAMTYLMSTGNAFFKKKQGSKGSTIVSFSDDNEARFEFDLLPSNLITIETTGKNEILRYCYRKNGADVSIQLTPEQVSHVKFIDPTLQGHTSHLGLSPLVACWNILKASNNLSVADASMLENKGVLGVMSNKNGVVAMTENERQEMQDATDGLLGGAEKFGQTLVSGTPIDYTPIGMSSNDLQMIQGGEFKNRLICTAFGVSSVMFNDQETATLDNMKIASRKLYTDSAIPNNDVLLRAYELGVFPTYEEKTGQKYRIIQDTSEIQELQTDGNQKSDKDAKNVDSLIKIVASDLPTALKVMILVDTFGMEESEITVMLEEADAKKEEEKLKLEEQMSAGREETGDEGGTGKPRGRPKGSRNGINREI
jgi:HK97 family phage portal protein